MVVSAMDPKLLIKMLQVTFTGGPAERTESRGHRWDLHREDPPSTGPTKTPPAAERIQTRWRWTGRSLFTGTSLNIILHIRGTVGAASALVLVWSRSGFLSWSSWFCRNSVVRFTSKGWSFFPRDNQRMNSCFLRLFWTIAPPNEQTLDLQDSPDVRFFLGANPTRRGGGDTFISILFLNGVLRGSGPPHVRTPAATGGAQHAKPLQLF